MFTVYIVTKLTSETVHNVLCVRVEELTYVQYKIIIIYSFIENKRDDIILNKEDLVSVNIYPEKR